LRKVTCEDLDEVRGFLGEFVNHWERWASMLRESGANLRELFESVTRDLGEVPLYGGCTAEFTMRYGTPAVDVICGGDSRTHYLDVASDLGTVFLMGAMRLPIAYSMYMFAVYPGTVSAKFVGDFREDGFESGELRISLCDERYSSRVWLSSLGNVWTILYGDMWRASISARRYYSSPNVDLGFLKPLVMKDFGEILGMLAVPLLKLKNWEKYLSEDNEVVRRIASYLAVL